MQRVTCATAYRSQCVHGGAPTGVGDRAGVRAHNRFLPLPRRLVPPVNLLSPFGFALGGHAALIAPQFYCVVLVWPLAHCALSTNTALPQAAAGSTPHDNAPCWASQQVGPLRWGPVLCVELDGTRQRACSGVARVLPSSQHQRPLWWFTRAPPQWGGTSLPPLRRRMAAGGSWAQARRHSAACAAPPTPCD